MSNRTFFADFWCKNQNQWVLRMAGCAGFFLENATKKKHFLHRQEWQSWNQLWWHFDLKNWRVGSGWDFTTCLFATKKLAPPISPWMKLWGPLLINVQKRRWFSNCFLSSPKKWSYGALLIASRGPPCIIIWMNLTVLFPFSLLECPQELTKWSGSVGYNPSSSPIYK